MTTWKMYSESKPLFSDLYLVKFKDGCFLGEYGVCYYSQEHKSFGEFISFYDSERDEDDEDFVPCKSIVAWTPFQRIDEEHKEKNAEQMFNDFGYTKPKYKLTQFEYDLLSVHKDYKTYNQITNQTHLFKMHEKGYFKYIDTNIPIREILDNCEVIK